MGQTDNRVGTINIGNQPNPKNLQNKMLYTAYQMLLDWNGDVFLCPQDWQRRQTVKHNARGNFKIWTDHPTKFRKQL